MKKLLFILAFLLLPCMAKGQGFLYTGIALNQNGRPIPNPTITVCTSAGAGVPCTPLVPTIYADAALTVAVSNPLPNCTIIFQAGCADAVGNFSFYIAPGEYTYTISGSGTTLAGPFKISIPCVINNGIDSCGGTGTFAYVPDTSSSYTSHATPTFQMGGTSGNKSTVFDFVLNQNVTAITFSVSNPPPANTTIFAQLNMCENGTGGFTVPNGAWPINVILPTGFTFTPTTAGTCFHLMFRYNPQTNTWTTVVDPGTGGGGGVTPSGSDGDLQKKSGSNLNPSGLNDNGTTVTSNEPVTINGVTTENGNVITKGPNPEFNVAAYGARALAFPAQTTTANCASSTSVTLASALDFINGDGIVLHQCGAATSLTTPSAPSSVVPKGILNGSTTRSYKVAAEDFSLGVTAASSATTITTGAATFQSNVVNITTASLVSGTISITTASTHNFEANSQVKIAGCNSNMNGVWMVKTTPSANTLTIDTPSKSRPDITSTCSTGTVEVPAHNFVYFTSQATAMRYLIYRQDNGAGSYNLVGIAQGLEPFYDDYNWGTPTLTGMPEVPTTAPASATNRALPTTIVSGAGTTNIVVADAALNTISGVAALHDNTAAFLAAHNAALAVKGGQVFIPNAAGNLFYLNFPYVMPPVSNNGNVTYLVSGGVFATQPTKNTLSTRIVGGAPNNHGTPSFATTNYGSWGGSSYPVMFLGNQNETDHMFISNSSGTNPGQWIVLCDQNCTTVNIHDSFMSVGANDSGSAPMVLRGVGFHYLFERNVFSATTSSKYFAPPGFRIMGSSVANAAPGEGKFLHTIFQMSQAIGIDNDAIPNFAVAQMGSPWLFSDIFSENSCGPLIGFHNINNSNWFNWSIEQIVRADPTCGLAPSVEMSAGVSLLDGLRLSSMEQGGTGGGSVNIGTAASNVSFYSESENDQYNFGSSYVAPQLSTVYGAPGAVRKVGKVIEANSVIRAIPPGVIIVQGDPPTNVTAGAPTSGGTLPVGTFPVAVTAVDSNGGQSGPSIPINVTTTTGNQTVQISWTAPSPPPAGYYVYFNGTAVNSGTLITGTSVVATGNLFQAIPTTAGGGPSGMSKTLLWGSQVKGGGIGGTQTTVTSNYTATINDFDIKADPTGGAFTVTLPHAVIGQPWHVQNITAGPNLVTVQPDSGTILIVGGSASSVALSSGVSDLLDCDGTNCELKSSNAGGSTNVIPSPQFAIGAYSGVGVTNTVTGFGPPTLAGLYIPFWNNPSPGATAPQVGQLGVFTNAQSTNYTAVAGDRAASIRFSGGTTATLTLPAIAAPFASNFPFRAPNYNSGNLTITPTTQLINGGANLTVLPGWRADVSQDNTPNWFADIIPTFSAFTGSCQAITFNSSTGFPCSTIFYQLIGNNGTSQTQRNRLNLIPGTNVTFTVADNAGSNSTDVTINSSGGGASSNACGTNPAPGAYTPSGTASTRECLAPGTYTLPTSVTTLANSNFVIYCANPGAIIQRGSGASGLKFTGNESGIDGCTLDDGTFTSTARFVEIQGTDDFVKNSIHQNPGTVSSALPVVDLTSSATRALITNNVFLGTQVDPCIGINSASTASGTIQGTVIENNRVAAFGPSASTGCIISNQVSGSTVTDTTIIKNKIVQTTSGATSISINGQAAVQNVAYKGWVINENQVSQTTTGGAGAIKIFGPYNGQATGNVIDLNGHATSSAAFNLGDFYDFKVDVTIHGGANENEVNCVDCENNHIHFIADNVGGGLNCFTGSSSQNPFNHNIITGVCRLAANATCVTIKGNANGKAANFNQVTVNCHGNGNASSFGVVLDIGNSSTGLWNKVIGSSFDGFNGATSIDINVNNAAMSKTFIGADNTFDSADTLSISDSGTGTIIESTPHTQTGALAAGTATVTFPGNGFISASTYNCVVRDTTTPANAITLGTFTATTVVLTGTGTDNYSLTCNGQRK